jgi:hypothetical protein
MRADALAAAVYSLRMLVFLETGPQTNQYRQVFLDFEEYKRVSFSLGSLVGSIENGTIASQVRLSEKEYKLPDLREINPE